MNSTYLIGNNSLGKKQDTPPLENNFKALKPQVPTSTDIYSHCGLSGKQDSANHKSPPSEHAAQHGLLGIRTRDFPSGANQISGYRPWPTSSSSNQKRPHYIIDLTGDDDEDGPSVPRKKSCSSIDSSDESVKIIGRHKKLVISKQEDDSPSLPTGQIKRDPDTPSIFKQGPAENSGISASSSFVSYSNFPAVQQAPFSPNQPRITAREQSHPLLKWKPSSPVPEKPLRPSKEEPHSPLTNVQPSFHSTSFELSPDPQAQLTRNQQRKRQYASAVVVHPTAPLAKPTPEEIQQRQQFERNMAVVSNVTLSNAIDNSSPPTSFRFLKESELKEGVYRAPEDVMIGCECRRKRGSNECKYPNECSCLKDSNGESKIKRSQYSDSGLRKGCLMKQVLQNRWNIFECNPRCDCSDNCKNRVVQWGRKVGLDIFKTQERGWGLRCHEDLQEGQFLDTYRGEVITTEEADQRKKGANEDNYLMDFDKFEDPKYVCDGMYMGGPTRFMNHSCEPNCALFTVSYNHYDSYLYELAFFAKQFIPAGTELTFDYLDQDEVEGGKITDEDAAQMEREKGYAPSVCRCGAKRCRGYFFFSK